MTTGRPLLAAYVHQKSEEAFRELVRRYVDLVYTTALRLVGGDVHLAEDVTQMVFADLARKASTLPENLMLGGWLHRHTCFVASKLIRGERRRQLRERQAVEMNAQPDHSKENLAEVSPVLDDAINALGAEDRLAILLRFFEQQDLHSIGVALGSSENAAQKRITRALEELRRLLLRRGVVLSTAVLSTTLATHAIAAAPAGLAAGISAAVLAESAAGCGTTWTLIKLAAMNKVQIGIVSAVAVVGVVAPIALHRHSALSADNNTLRELLASSTGAKTPAPQIIAPGSSADPDAELVRLSSELAQLRERMAYLQNPSNAARLWSEAQPKAYAEAHRTGLLMPEEDFTNGLPRDVWVFSGYATPKAAAQSLMWAMSEGNVDVLFQSYADEAFDGKTWDANARNEFAATVRSRMNGIVRFEGLRQRLEVPMDGTHVVMSFAPVLEDGQRSRSVNFSLRKVGGEWKSVNRISRFRPPGQP